MGDKSRAKKAMIKAGVPVVPGSPGVVEDEEKALKVAKEIGFPVILKASAGGGGRGMRIVRAAARAAGAPSAPRRPRRRPPSASPTSTSRSTWRRRATSRSRSWPTRAATSVHLGERECSIQRRHQKIIEEAPSPVVSEKLRRRMGQTAVEAARAVQYVNAGTVEFLLDASGNFYFMEMNTRIQVEHGVTELDHRPRPGEGADPGGGGGAALLRAEGPRVLRATPSSAASTPRTP